MIHENRQTKNGNILFLILIFIMITTDFKIHIVPLSVFTTQKFIFRFKQGDSPRQGEKIIQFTDWLWHPEEKAQFKNRPTQRRLFYDTYHQTKTNVRKV